MVETPVDLHLIHLLLPTPLFDLLLTPWNSVLLPLRKPEFLAPAALLPPLLAPAALLHPQLMVETPDPDLPIHLPLPTPLINLLLLTPWNSVHLLLLKPLSPEFLEPAALLTARLKPNVSEKSRHNVLNVNEKLNDVVKNKRDGKPSVKLNANVLNESDENGENKWIARTANAKNNSNESVKKHNVDDRKRKLNALLIENDNDRSLNKDARKSVNDKPNLLGSELNNNVKCVNNSKLNVKNNKDVSKNNERNKDVFKRNELRRKRKPSDNNKSVFNNNVKLNNALLKRLLNVPLLRPLDNNKLPPPRLPNARPKLLPNVLLNKPPPRLLNVPLQLPPNVLLNKLPPRLLNVLPKPPPCNEHVPSVLADTPLPPPTQLYNNPPLNQLPQLGLLP
jgi:hypothetical protein